MRPVKLTVEGLRSFRAPVEVSFDGRDHIAIIGDTGAGKSSLLQAITWALFGRTTFSGQPNQELMNATSTSLRVVLDFLVVGQRWQAVRVLKRAGDGQVGPARASLALLADDGTVLEQVEKVGPVNSRVEQILGLDFDAFVRTVLLPQGEFAKLLVGDTPRERAQILAQVWRTDELTAAGHAAAELHSSLQPLTARIRQAREGTPEDPAAHHAALQEAATTARAVADAAAGTGQQAAMAQRALEEALGRQTTAGEVLEQLRDFSGEAAAATAGHLSATAAGLAERRERVDAAGSELRRQLAAVPADTDGWDATTVATARQQLRQLTTAADALRSHVEDLVRADAAMISAQRDAEQAEDSAAEAGAASEQRIRGRNRIAEEAQKAVGRLSDARTALERARDSAAQAANAEADASERAAQLGPLEEAADAAEERAQRVRAVAEQAARDLERLQRRDAAATVAHGLQSGDHCPVCERALPEEWSAPASPNLEAARQASREAATAASVAEQSATKARSRAEAAKEHAQGARQTAATVRQQADRHLDALAGHLQVDRTRLDLSALSDTILAPLAAADEHARAALDDYDQRSQTFTGAAAAARAQADAAQRTAEERESAAQQARTRAGGALESLHQLRAALPADLATLVRLPATVEQVGPDWQVAGIDTAEDRLDGRQRVLEDREQARTRLRLRIEQLDGQARDLDAAVATQVTGPARQLASTLDEHRDVLRQAHRQLEQAAGTSPGVDIPPLAATVDPTQLPRHVVAVAAATRRLQQTAHGLTRAAGQAAADAIATLNGIAVEAGLHIDATSDAAAIVAALDRLAGDTEYAARNAQAEADRFAPQAGPLAELAEAADRLAVTSRVVGDLAAALKPGAFPKWLTLRRSRALLVYASRLLHEMTGGRYAFADLDDDQAAWLVIDNDSGQPRSPQSLSGGEQFIASLALALGIVEMMARSGGRLESLWLDEGFGALDRSNLDAAVEALATVASGGRMVAVISHVQAVAEQVEHVLAITRTPTGSQATWLSADERRDVAEADAAADIGGALSGLVA